MEKLLNLNQSAYDQIVRQILLIQEGERIDVSVDRQEVVDAIAKIPQFQVNGKFDRNTYLQVLSYQRIPTEEFEADQKRTIFTQRPKRHCRTVSPSAMPMSKQNSLSRMRRVTSLLSASIQPILKKCQGQRRTVERLLRGEPGTISVPGPYLVALPAVRSGPLHR